jgi:ubiquinone/menaquinone biosynthesis C-methylase UbiE
MRILAMILIGVPILFLILHTIVRIVRFFYKFPIPEFMANLIDNPFRRRIQPPDDMPLRHGIQPGMRVLEIGPGNGTYTIATAKAVGSAGQIVTIDIEPKMIQRVSRKIQLEGIQNIDARVADVYKLPFEDGYFNLVYMIAVIGEIPEPEKAITEFYRVLSPGGVLAFSEILMDPDYPTAKKLIRLASSAGFKLKSKLGNFFSYTITFEKGTTLE